jgi:trans-aconitate 2-methyltransferase
MRWNADNYNTYKTERSQPFFDALQLVQKRKGMKVIDLGCGDGEFTNILSEYLEDAEITAIDSSLNMMEKAFRFEKPGLRFLIKNIEEQLASNNKWDLVFSNAALHWVNNHSYLFKQLAASIDPGGQLVVQMPCQNQNMSNRLMREVAEQEPFSKYFTASEIHSPVLDAETYCELLFELGATDINIFEKIYVMTFPDVNSIYNFTAATALLSYAEKLPEDVFANYIEKYQELLDAAFPILPALYPFRRILISCRF